MRWGMLVPVSFFKEIHASSRPRPRPQARQHVQVLRLQDSNPVQPPPLPPLMKSPHLLTLVWLLR